MRVFRQEAQRIARCQHGLEDLARLIVLATFVGGAAAGLAGSVEVAAIHGNANASLVTGYGYTGVLVAFIARQNAAAVIPVALPDVAPPGSAPTVPHTAS